MESIHLSKLLIKPISAQDTYPIRHVVLRKGKPIDSCQFNGDLDNTTFHLGAFFNKILVGVASYMMNRNDVFSEEHHYQLRGMAIIDDYKGLGIGNRLLENGEEKCLKANVNLIWFNAREIAINFYKRNNYQETGDFFNIEGVGNHILMSKYLLKTKPNNIQNL
jgi:ribosomal-protein-alanine N-acetyltransferase